ncbi:hypothetical protein Gotri_011646 [Gossypium trilobum]|uniref:Reverse transcriptase zinc-binding domain-containing protein n=1 Tax=Gossypium trilobum TaxID=34281 RepID=A0A7J9EUX1_9ROSI|nr:hypothetical protein [Gossypium trilobum]
MLKILIKPLTVDKDIPFQYPIDEFQNLGKFNIALLAKQGWRLMENPNSLLARTLKSKYYPESDFLQAELGYYPSFTWRSVWSTKKLLKEGMARRVGKGDQILIWTDAWIPGLEEYKIRETVRNNSYEKVADLIDPNLIIWKEDVITSLFSREETNAILSTSLAKYPQEDFRIWNREQTGEYTVRSGYRGFTKEISKPNTTTTNIIDINTFFHEELWQTDLPGKIKITNWRVYNGYIPTMGNLHYKRICNNAMCPCYREMAESMEHTFRDCQAFGTYGKQRDTLPTECLERLILLSSNTGSWGVHDEEAVDLMEP